MPRQILFVVAGTCLPAVFLILAGIIKAVRRLGVFGLWLAGGDLLLAHLKQVLVMLHPPAQERAKAGGTTPANPGPDGADPFTPDCLLF
jgi:hypothetical protein